MITKLYCLEIKETARIAKVIYPLMVLVTAAAALLSLLRIPILTNISTVISIMMLIFGLSFMLIQTVINDYHNFQGKRGYLFRSIPAKSSEFLLSRLAYYLTYFLASIIIFVLLLITILEITSEAPVFQLVKLFLSQGVFASPWGVGFSLYLFFTLVVSAIALIFAITVGSEARFHRIGAGGPVLVYFIYYLVGQFLSLASMFFIPLGVKISFHPGTDSITRIELVTEGMFQYFLDTIRLTGDPTQTIIGLGFIFVQLLLAFVIVVLTYRSFDKKFSLKS